MAQENRCLYCEKAAEVFCICSRKPTFFCQEHSKKSTHDPSNLIACNGFPYSRFHLFEKFGREKFIAHEKKRDQALNRIEELWKCETAAHDECKVSLRAIRKSVNTLNARFHTLKNRSLDNLNKFFDKHAERSDFNTMLEFASQSTKAFHKAYQMSSWENLERSLKSMESNCEAELHKEIVSEIPTIKSHGDASVSERELPPPVQKQAFAGQMLPNIPSPRYLMQASTEFPKPVYLSLRSNPYGNFAPLNLCKKAEMNLSRKPQSKLFITGTTHHITPRSRKGYSDRDSSVSYRRGPLNINSITLK